MENYAYLNANNEPSGFTNNWLEARDSTHLFEQNYNDFALYEEHRTGPNNYATSYDNSYRDVLKTLVARDPVSDYFFSHDNIQHLKKLICDTIYRQSGGLYNLTPAAQSTHALLTVMRSLFIENAKHLPEKIKEQVAELNYLVLLDMVPRVISNVQQNLAYQRDHSQQHLTMDRPQFISSAGTRSNRSVTTTFI